MSDEPVVGELGSSSDVGPVVLPILLPNELLNSVQEKSVHVGRRAL